MLANGDWLPFEPAVWGTAVFWHFAFQGCHLMGSFFNDHEWRVS